MIRDAPFGSSRPEIRVPPPGPVSRELARRLRRVESRNVTYVDETWPVFWDEALGTNVRDVDGNVYVDLTAAFGVALLGHRSPLTLAALGRQSERLVHGMGDVHPPAIKLDVMERLCALMPWSESRVVLSSTGSEAVETGLKTAALATGRPGILAFEGGYHGLTLGSLAVTERAHFRSPFAGRTYDGVSFVPFPTSGRSGGAEPDVVLEAVARALERGAPNGDAIGTLVVEPVQARGGARIPPPGFMERLSRLVRGAGGIVVADEIMTGLGRCGAVLASERVGLTPDIVCLGKSLGGGLPLSACVGRAEIMDAWPESTGEAIHTSTFLGHPLACAVAIDVLDHLAAGRTAGRAEEEGARLLAAIEPLAGAPGVAEVRGMGLLLGIELEAPGETAPVAPAARVAVAALERGLLVLPAGDSGGVVELTPPLGLTDAQLAVVGERLHDAVASAQRPIHAS